MAIIATKTGGTSTPMEEGSYPARIYQVIHLGTIPGFQGAMQNKVRIGFEFPTETKVFKEENGEQPYVLSQDYTLSFHEKAGLRKLIAACDPQALKAGEDGFAEEYDIENLIGKTCLIAVKHKEAKVGENVYANVDIATPMPKGMTCPPAVNPPLVLNYDNFDYVAFGKLPKFIQDKMMSSWEYKKLNEDPNEEPFPTQGLSDDEMNLEDIPM